MAGAVCWGTGDNRLKPLVLSEDERRTLENWVKRRSTAQGLASHETRAQAISIYFFLFAYTGLAIAVIGVGVAADHVGDFRAVLGCSIVLALLCVLAAAGISGGRRAGRPRVRVGAR